MQKFIFLGLIILTQFLLANPKGYSVETIATPKDAYFHIAGLDIDEQGRVYCATRYGDVWILDKGKWIQFAKGLQEPCGLVVDDDGSVVVTQKPEMTRLVDSDKDGVADLYLKLSHEWEFHNNYHEFNFGGVKDNEGNFIGALNLAAGPKVPGLKLSAMSTEGGYRGWAYKVSPEGEFTPIASGLRSPAGLGKNPQGELFFTDNQGDYLASSTLNQLEPGKFYGHPISLLDKPEYDMATLKNMDDQEFDQMRTLPIVWIPQEEIANSPGNPEWNATKGKFGPFDDQFFIGDQSRSNIFRVSLQKVAGRYQGVVINFMSGFQCGNIRLKFDPEGNLWTGQTSRGWASRGSRPYGLQKITWDQKTIPFEILDVKLQKNGFKIDFTQKINFQDAKKIKISRWWYEYSRKYGAPKSDFEDITPQSIKVSEDGMSMTVSCSLMKERVYCFDLSELSDNKNEKLANKKAYYTIIHLIE